MLIFIHPVFLQVTEAQPSSTTKQTQIGLEEKIQLLKERQNLVAEAFEKNLDNLYTMSQWSVVILAAVNIIYIFLSLFKKEEKKYLEEILNTMSLFRENIETTNDLMDAVTKTLENQNKSLAIIDRIENQIETFEHFKTNEEEKLKSAIDSINISAIEGFKRAQIFLSLEAELPKSSNISLFRVGNDEITVCSTG